MSHRNGMRLQDDRLVQDPCIALGQGEAPFQVDTSRRSQSRGVSLSLLVNSPSKLRSNMSRKVSRQILSQKQKQIRLKVRSSWEHVLAVHQCGTDPPNAPDFGDSNRMKMTNSAPSSDISATPAQISSPNSIARRSQRNLDAPPMAYRLHPPALHLKGCIDLAGG